MRLTSHQRQQIQLLVHQQLGGGARVLLFGSRLQEQRKGGDIDLFLESPLLVPRLQQAALKLELEDALQLPVDLSDQPLTPFQALAKAQSRPLTEALP